jgi:hypothetical protein
MIAHDVLTYLCAEDTLPCDELIEITLYTYEEHDRDLYNPNSEIEMRDRRRPSVVSEDPMIDEDRYYEDFVKYHPPNGNTVRTGETIALYSAEPDWGMDEEITVTPLQEFTGGSAGYRHMRYSLFWARVGVAHRRAEHFTELSRKAFDAGDRYWGVRFAARAIHYIEDLLTPFHQKPFTEGYFLRVLFSLKRMGGLFVVAFNYHHSFERYTGYHLWHGTSWFIEAIRNAPSIEICNIEIGLKKAWRRAKRLFYPLFREWRRLLQDKMENGQRFLSPSEVAAIDPPERLKDLIEEWLGLASGVVKGYISRYVAPYIEDRCR